MNKITTELQAIVQLELGILLLGLLSLVMVLDLDGDFVSKLHAHGRIYSRVRVALLLACEEVQLCL